MRDSSAPKLYLHQIAFGVFHCQNAHEKILYLQKNLHQNLELISGFVSIYMNIKDFIEENFPMPKWNAVCSFLGISKFFFLISTPTMEHYLPDIVFNF